MMTQMNAISISVSMLGIWPAIAAHSTCTRSAGHKAGHRRPSAVLVSSKPAALASSPEMSRAANAR